MQVKPAPGHRVQSVKSSMKSEATLDCDCHHMACASSCDGKSIHTKVEMLLVLLLFMFSGIEEAWSCNYRSVQCNRAGHLCHTAKHKTGGGTWHQTL